MAVIRSTAQGFILEENGKTIEVRWLNRQGESSAHYDIEIIENEKTSFVEVKSTKDSKKDYFPISKEQWTLMKGKGNDFCIYRVYGVGTEEVKLEKIHNPAKLWKEGYIDAYPIRVEL